MTIEETLISVGEYLETIDALKCIGVVVDKQQDMDEEMKTIQSKNDGYVITVGEIDNSSLNDVKEHQRLKLRFGVTIYSPKIVMRGKVAGSTLRDAVIRELNGFQPDPAPYRCDWVKYKNGKTMLEENRSRQVFMVHAMSFEVEAQY